MSKWIAVTLGALLLLTNGFWIYSAIDLAVTEKFRQQEEYKASHRLKVLERLCNKLVGGMSKSDAIKLLNELSPESAAYVNKDRLNTLWLTLKTDGHGNVAENGACQ